MIKVTIRRNESGHIKSFTIDGHANYAKHGEDIVCAGVSTVSIGTVNSIIALTGVEPNVKLGKDGYLHCDIPDRLSEQTADKVQLILETMLVSLQSVEQEYGKYVKITQK